MARKVDKLRPYRVDWFDVNEMIDNDKVLVRSVITRAVTAKQAAEDIEEIRTVERNSPVVVIRAYRFYKKLLKHRKDVYKAVEDLFTAKQATEFMELIEEYRRKKIDAQFAAAAGKFPTDPLADKTFAEALDDAGFKPVGGQRLELTEAPCGTSEIASRNDYTDPDVPTTGPDSPATQAVVADLQGMVDHDVHEQVMDTFVPLPGQGVDFVDKNAALAAAPLVTSVDKTKLHPDHPDHVCTDKCYDIVPLVGHTPFLTTCPVCDGPCKGDYGQLPVAEHGDDIAAALTAVEVPSGYVLTDTTQPLRYADPPPDQSLGSEPMSLDMKIALFGIVGFFVIVIVVAILH